MRGGARYGFSDAGGMNCLFEGTAMSINSVNSTTTAELGSATSADSTGTAASATVTIMNSAAPCRRIEEVDPTNPADPTQYMSQLASFSSVEQQVETNSTLDSCWPLRPAAWSARP